MAVTFRKAVLDNGLTVVAECDPLGHSAAAGFFVKTGARDEAPVVMGVSHFLEHMMFKGTAKRTAEKINRDFDKIGAKNNAYTSGEMTCFHATVLPEHLLGEEGGLEILSDMMRPALRQDDFDTEKNVILEEIAMYEDNPFWVLYERVMEEHFSWTDGRKHPLGHRVLGTKQTITDLTSTQMRDYFRTRYSADNTVVALAGRVDFDRAVEEIDALCGSWQRTGATRSPGGPAMMDRSVEIRDEKVSRAYLVVLAPAPASDDPKRYAASLLAQVLGGPDNSRLHWSLVETGLAEQAEVGYEPKDGTGDFLVYIACEPERREEIWATVEKEIAGLRGTLCDADLEKIRCKAATGVTLAGERPGGRMQRLGRQWTYLGSYTTLEEELSRINAVSVEDVRAVFEEYPLGPRTVGWLMPE
ncbi:MAG TPA: pitrilysin family protein [Phycisphaerales bacterium]|mgnify:CR=1 FL=1|nr:pitrilysin family protein [Phycisphaerales bacterium]